MLGKKEAPELSKPSGSVLIHYTSFFYVAYQGFSTKMMYMFYFQ